MRRLPILLLAAATLSACDNGTGVEEGATVSVRFQSATATAAAPAGAMAMFTPQAMTLTGSNGVLVLDRVDVILNEFELERVEDLVGCDDDVDDDGCEKFEAAPSFLNLPLEGGAATAVTGEVPVGQYSELEFEIEDLEDDEENPEEAAQIEALFASVRAQFADWPREASMRVAGTFTPEGGEAMPFVVYFQAEIEVELEFATPFVVTEDDLSRSISVELQPADWFLNTDGTVMNLAEFDFATTNTVKEFEVEIENGFKQVEHDDEDDD